MNQEAIQFPTRHHPLREDIRALALPEIRAFYRTWYAPNNATIVCVGDFDDEQLRTLIAAAYGHLPPAQLPVDARITEPAQTRERIVRAPKPIAN